MMSCSKPGSSHRKFNISSVAKSTLANFKNASSPKCLIPPKSAISLWFLFWIIFLESGQSQPTQGSKSRGSREVSRAFALSWGHGPGFCHVLGRTCQDWQNISAVPTKKRKRLELFLGGMPKTRFAPKTPWPPKTKPSFLHLRGLPSLPLT